MTYPPTEKGQLITFAVEIDEDQASRMKKWVKINVKVGDTVRSICGERGHPEDAKVIMQRNKGIRSARQVLRHAKTGTAANKRLRKRDILKLEVPGELRKVLSFQVLAGDTPPGPVGGYAKFSTINRPERVGLTRFDGYDPWTIEVPIQFEAWAQQGGQSGGQEGKEIEDDIQLLERMAGRGQFRGANVGPPPVIRLSTTNADGGVVLLLSEQFQWTPDSDGPLWRVTDIDWDPDALRGETGKRLRQKAVVRLQQHTHITLASRSASQRARSRPGRGVVRFGPDAATRRRIAGN